MLGSRTPVQVSRKRRMEVWSKICEQTRPPRVHGEIRTIGTRTPRPMGWPSINSFTVPGGGTGAGRWSKNPPFSSYVRMKTVDADTEAFEASASRSSLTKFSPEFGDPAGCSEMLHGATIQDICAKVPLVTS